MEFLKNINKVAKIAIIVALILILIITIYAISKKSGSDTVNMNQTLNIKQSNLNYDFSIKVNSIEETSITEAFSESETYKVVNLTMTNRASVPNPLYVQYELIDSKGNELAYGSSLNTPLSSSINSEDNFDETNLETNSSTTGNLYFETDSTDVQKLKITVVTKGLQSTDSDVEYYYINLK